MTEDRTIAEFHATRESGSGCPEVDGGPHYFAHLIGSGHDGRVCIDCGEPENYVPKGASGGHHENG